MSEHETIRHLADCPNDDTPQRRELVTQLIDPRKTSFHRIFLDQQRYALSLARGGPVIGPDGTVAGEAAAMAMDAKWTDPELAWLASATCEATLMELEDLLRG